MPLTPKTGTLERVMLDALERCPDGVTFLDLVGTGITEQNIDQIAQNLRTGMFVSDDDEAIKLDA